MIVKQVQIIAEMNNQATLKHDVICISDDADNG